jgi:hypothetical protein
MFTLFLLIALEEATRIILIRDKKQQSNFLNSDLGGSNVDVIESINYLFLP